MSSGLISAPHNAPSSSVLPLPWDFAESARRRPLSSPSPSSVTSIGAVASACGQPPHSAAAAAASASAAAAATGKKHVGFTSPSTTRTDRYRNRQDVQKEWPQGNV